jgi:hypothetical protein
MMKEAKENRVDGVGWVNNRRKVFDLIDPPLFSWEGFKPGTGGSVGLENLAPHLFRLKP